jgi:hypothetical protein
MIDLQNMVVKTLVANDNARARSQQTAIGPSAIGGCHRRLWHDIAQTEPTNVGDKLGAILGTFIHTGIEDAIRREDPFGVQYELEIAVESDGVPGHVDCYDKINHTVIDWKTIKKGSGRYFGGNNRQQVWQIHLYGYLLIKNGYTVKDVALVGIPRDGKMSDILVYMQPYDEAIALQALEHLEKTREMVTQQLQPRPEKPLAFCADFCPYYDPTGEEGCPSTQKYIGKMQNVGG